MQLNTLDRVVISVRLVASFSPALFFTCRAGRGTAEFFASGRAAPWWPPPSAPTHRTWLPTWCTGKGRQPIELVGLPAHRDDDGVFFARLWRLLRSI